MGKSLSMRTGKREWMTLYSRVTAVLLWLSLLSFGCGGGGGGSSPPTPSPPPPSPDFSFGLTPTGVALVVGTTSLPVEVNLNALNGFSGVVSVSVESLPAGVSASPSGFTFDAGERQLITFTASLSVQKGTFNIVLRGTSGSLARTASLTIAVVQGRSSRTSFSKASGRVVDVLYDSSRKLVFATVPDLNRVDVFSSSNGSLVKSIPVSSPYGIDIAPGGKTIYTGSYAEQLTLIDVDLLQVRERIDMFTYVPIARQTLVAPMLAVLSNGQIMFGVLDPNASPSGGLMKWDPATGSKVFQYPNIPGAPSLSQMARSGDYSRVLVSGVGSGVALYDVGTDSYIAVQSFTQTVVGIAANQDGTQFAAIDSGNTVFFLDDQLQIKGSVRIASGPGPIIFSRDGTRLFVASGYIYAPEYTALDTRTFAEVGRVSCNFNNIPFATTLPIAIDENSTLFVAQEQGVAFVDMSSPRNLAPIATTGGAYVNPDFGRSDGPTDVSVLIGQIGPIDPGTQVFFGDLPGLSQQISGNTILTKTPAIGQQGPVLVTAESPAGHAWYGVGGFMFGPEVWYMMPNVGTPDGGSSVKLMGAGFSSSSLPITVTIGGKSASASRSAEGQTVLSIFTPQGTPGTFDVVLQTPQGSATLAGGFQFARASNKFPVTGALEQLLYDDSRQLLYATNSGQNRIEVFSVATKTLQSPIAVSGAPTKMAFTPDRSTLLVTCPLIDSLAVVDLSTRTVRNMILLPANSQQIAWNVAALDGNRAFVEMRFLGSGSAGALAEVDLVTRTAQVRTETSFFMGENLLAASADGKTALVTERNSSGGTASIWDSSSNTFQFRGIDWYIFDSDLSADGNVLAITTSRNPYQARFYDTKIHHLGWVQGLPSYLTFDNAYYEGHKLHASGALLYVPVTVYRENAFAVDVYDVHTGSLVLRIPLAEPLRMGGVDALAISQDGRFVFANTENGFAVVELADVPLSIGSVSPAAGVSSGGTKVTIRGSGFVNGATVEFGKIRVPATFDDSNTLKASTPVGSSGTVVVSIINPNGKKYTLQAGFQYQ